MGFVQKKRYISSFRIILLGFMLVIIAGTLLLMLPISGREGGTTLLNALFTATSAVCVTGLVVHDTATHWSLFGQAVILALIQIGGMGVMTIALTITSLSGRKIGLMQRSAMQDAISAPGVGGIVRMTGFIFRSVIIIELLGALVLATVFCPQYGLPEGLWYSVFHSVSAFCNAGFDLSGINGEYSSLTAYTGSPLVNITVMTLIVTGGIGFFVWDDVRKNKFNIHRYRMQTKVVLSVTAILIVLPAVYFFFTEFSGFAIKERVLASLFQSVTTRTAGFNTVDLTTVSEVGLMIMVFLMLVGGSPGSTAGGMKTTTLAVLLSASLSVFRRKQQTQFFGRRVADSTVKQATTVFMMYITLFFSSGLVISAIEGLPVVTSLYETASAIGTVGLTLGITPELSAVSKLILIMLMFFGRVGGLTLIFAAMSDRKPDVSKYPEERITVG